MKEIAPAPPPECNWTGFYIGAFGGYSWGKTKFLEEDAFDPAFDFDTAGFLGGGEAGLNWQIGSWLVLGAEVTFAGGDFSDNASFETPGGEIADGHVDSNWLGTVGGRVGVSLFHDHILVFAKGGAGFTHFDFRTHEITEGERFRAEDDTRTGGLVGGGLEYAFNCHWSIKAEYNHIFFGHDEVTGLERLGGGVTNVQTFRADGDRDTVVGGLNFKF